MLRTSAAAHFRALPAAHVAAVAAICTALTAQHHGWYASQSASPLTPSPAASACASAGLRCTTPRSACQAGTPSQQARVDQAVPPLPLAALAAALLLAGNRHLDREGSCRRVMRTVLGEERSQALLRALQGLPAHVVQPHTQSARWAAARDAEDWGWTGSASELLKLRLALRRVAGSSQAATSCDNLLQCVAVLQQGWALMLQLVHGTLQRHVLDRTIWLELLSANMHVGALPFLPASSVYTLVQLASHPLCSSSNHMFLQHAILQAASPDPLPTCLGKSLRPLPYDQARTHAYAVLQDAGLVHVAVAPLAALLLAPAAASACSTTNRPAVARSAAAPARKLEHHLSSHSDTVLAAQHPTSPPRRTNSPRSASCPRAGASKRGCSDAEQMLAGLSNGRPSTGRSHSALRTRTVGTPDDYDCANSSDSSRGPSPQPPVARVVSPPAQGHLSGRIAQAAMSAVVESVHARVQLVKNMLQVGSERGWSLPDCAVEASVRRAVVHYHSRVGSSWHGTTRRQPTPTNQSGLRISTPGSHALLTGGDLAWQGQWATWHDDGTAAGSGLVRLAVGLEEHYVMRELTPVLRTARALCSRESFQQALPHLRAALVPYLQLVEPGLDWEAPAVLQCVKEWMLASPEFAADMCQALLSRWRASASTQGMLVLRMLLETAGAWASAKLGARALQLCGLYLARLRVSIATGSLGQAMSALQLVADIARMVLAAADSPDASAKLAPVPLTASFKSQVTAMSAAFQGCACAEWCATLRSAVHETAQGPLAQVQALLAMHQCDSLPSSSASTVSGDSASLATPPASPVAGGSQGMPLFTTPPALVHATA